MLFRASEETLVDTTNLSGQLTARPDREGPKKDVEAQLTNDEPVEKAPCHSPDQALAAEGDVIWVEFSPSSDPDDPFQWSRMRKWTITCSMCLFALYAPWVGGAFSIGVDQMIAELGCARELAQLASSIFPLGFGIGPLLLAPLSEEVGRAPIYIVTLFLSFMMCLPTGLSPNITGVIISRFLGGLSSSVGSTLVGGTLADIWQSSERGFPMSLFSLVSFTGIALGPMASGYLVQDIQPNGWRYIQYIQVAWGGAVFIIVLSTLRETRGSVILRRRAQRLRKETGDSRYQARSEAGSGSFFDLLRHSLSRAVVFLFTEPSVATMSIYIAFIWGVVWALLSAIPLTFSGPYYGFNSGEQGLAFTGLAVGSIVAWLLSFVQERLYRKHVAVHGPEARLCLTLVGGFFLPIGAFVYAGAQSRTHWIVPQIGLALLWCGAYTIFLSIFSYQSDVYLRYASSALAAQSMLRNVAGFTFPLFIDQMIDALTITWTCALFGFLGTAMAFIPLVFFRYGSAIRRRSRVALQLEREFAQRQEQQR